MTTTAKKAASKKAADDEPKASERHSKAKQTSEQEAAIDAGLRAWSQAQRELDVIEANLADPNLLPRDRLRLQGQLAEQHQRQADARAQVTGTA